MLSFFSISILAITLFLIDQHEILDRVHFFFLYRIPAFILGMVCAFWIKNNISTKYYYAFLLAGIPIFCYFFFFLHQLYNYKYFSLLFLLPFFTIFFIVISKNINRFNPIIRAIGNASLEIYLIQSILFYALTNDLVIIPSVWHDTITVSLIFLCSIIGIIIHWAMSKALLKFL